ncbi:Uncharacterised protein [Legionella beliardensis]|uniref:Uncharacterized protein n=1 Tax=Legionella beliardensis TaxID=91822 RepID=A0A378JY53_9GAMM|nr:hypothetical protein [Legionella beliardensis]STX55682.1 Uncharacterised protein [Legionella beliardensis]
MMGDLEKVLATDLEALKHLDLSIISASAYYGRLLSGWLFLFALLLAIQSAACFFAITIQAWDYAPHAERWEKSSMEHENREDLSRHSFATLHDLRWKFPDASEEELKLIQKEKERRWEEGFVKRKKERELTYKEARLDEHALLTAKMVFGVFFSSLLMSLFGLGFIKNYIIFKLQISPKLRTGAYLIKKTKWAFTGFFLIFGVFTFVFIPLFEQDVVFFSSIPCLIIAAIATSIAVNMEVSRIGVSVLSKAISNFFYKEKERV